MFISPTTLFYFSVPATVSDAINKVFFDLEKKYGRLFVSKALGYLTLGMGGLTESELLEALSMDDAVLDEVNNRLFIN